MEEYVIQPKEEGKGRSFLATCIALATADGLWDSQGKTKRPVWAMFANLDTALRPFMANLRLGRKAERLSNANRKGSDEERIEFLKSVGYQVAWQREPEASIATIFLPDLFRLDPGMVDPAGMKFVLLVPTDWSDAQEVDPAGPVQHVEAMLTKPHQNDYRGQSRVQRLDTAYLESLVPTAYLFAAYLDRRTRCPLVADGRFYLQLLLASLDKGFASFPGNNARYVSMHNDKWGYHGRHAFNIELGGESYSRDEIDTVGLKHAFSFLASHETFEAFLAEQVTLFFSRVSGESRPVTEQIDFSEFASDAL